MVLIIAIHSSFTYIVPDVETCGNISLSDCVYTAFGTYVEASYTGVINPGEIINVILTAGAVTQVTSAQITGTNTKVRINIDPSFGNSLQLHFERVCNNGVSNKVFTTTFAPCGFDIWFPIPGAAFLTGWGSDVTYPAQFKIKNGTLHLRGMVVKNIIIDSKCADPNGVLSENFIDLNAFGSRLNLTGNDYYGDKNIVIPFLVGGCDTVGTIIGSIRRLGGILNVGIRSVALAVFNSTFTVPNNPARLALSDIHIVA